MTVKGQSRRGFLQAAGISAAAALAGQATSKAQEPESLGIVTGAAPKFELGLASYTLRKFKLDEALKMR